MQAFHFGVPERRLFGCFHAAGPVRATGAVLICAPYGQEYVRSHRMFRVLAERLARSGCDVLRFDPFGSGDADGDDEALEWDGWVADIRSASAELHSRSRAVRQVWVGARLGGTAACAAAAGAARPPAALVLCEPVLDGAVYLQSVAVATVEALEASCSIKDPAWRLSLATDPQRWEREGVGFAMGPALQRQLRALTPAAVGVPAGTSVALLSSGAMPLLDAQALAWRAAGVQAQHEVLPFAFDWTAEEALNTALVPHEMLQRLVQLTLDSIAPGGAGAR